MFTLKARLSHLKTSNPAAEISDSPDATLPNDANEWFHLDDDGNITQHIESNPTNIGVADAQADTEQVN